MKNNLLTLFLFLIVITGCKKKEKEINTNHLSGTSWIYAYDSCKGLNFANDSITEYNCINSVKYGYSYLSNDTFIVYISNGVVNSKKIIIRVTGDTLLWVIPDYTIRDSKYIRK